MVQEKSKFYVFVQYTETTPAVIGVFATDEKEAAELVLDSFKEEVPDMEVVRVETAIDEDQETIH